MRQEAEVQQGEALRLTAALEASRMEYEDLQLALREEAGERSKLVSDCPYISLAGSCILLMIMIVIANGQQHVIIVDELREALEVTERLKVEHHGQMESLKAEAEQRLGRERLEVQRWMEAIEGAEAEAARAAAEAVEREEGLRRELDELQVGSPSAVPCRC